LIQFSKVGHVSWLFVGILNAFPEVSVNTPFAVAFGLSLNVMLGIFNEGISDYSRHLSDKKINTTTVNKVGTLENGPNRIVKTELQNIKVGDIIVLGDKQQIPADCVVLKATSENGGIGGFI
jgi:magnesium-transporting ATPase (P-type)